MTSFNIPNGKGVPLVDLDTDLLPQPTMDALDARYGGGGATEQYVDDAVTAHAIDPTPHTAYDDMADLTILFENGLV